MTYHLQYGSCFLQEGTKSDLATESAGCKGQKGGNMTYHIGVLSRCCGGGFKELKSLHQALEKASIPVETKSLKGHDQRTLRKSLEDSKKIDPKSRSSYLFCEEVAGVWKDSEWNGMLLKILEEHGREQASNAGAGAAAPSAPATA